MNATSPHNSATGTSTTEEKQPAGAINKTLAGTISQTSCSNANMGSASAVSPGAVSKAISKRTPKVDDLFTVSGHLLKAFPDDDLNEKVAEVQGRRGVNHNDNASTRSISSRASKVSSTLDAIRAVPTSTSLGDKEASRSYTDDSGGDVIGILAVQTNFEAECEKNSLTGKSLAVGSVLSRISGRARDGKMAMNGTRLHPHPAVWGPINVKNLKPGSEVLYCTCGLSRSQPFCDWSHVGTGFKPLEWTVPGRKDSSVGCKALKLCGAQRSQAMFSLCGCKQTRTPPFCDASHTSVAHEVNVRQKQCPNNHEEIKKLCTDCGSDCRDPGLVW
ncbi:hypothetical protein SARC_11169 [Sphaeroforma arctica JP610]|uniref:Iron-binding zinc finger CDGSH type domain-containing protein n=1 Tax=Sphaeroforma arctica JP610 TaxID=667725 RepID=A0A0L0FHR5_9EUKA|nr:hypothetical protein SARC_11169 [Sphaeroforma arctica JP610]KNC76324.1 hypothetical protein SARC_11169 [Sphaeroforma arctica JP610]|eukprot:XP_014150226.1 hypothetical protein SARC_11169 [Sphaeroforma arctica JP610]